jgi:hypothetical protein
MATHVKTFNFLTDLESWAANSPDSMVIMSHSSSNNAPGSSGGSLQTSVNGDSDYGFADWEWNGNYQALGVPSGENIRSISARLYYSVSGFSGLNPNDVGHLRMNDNLGAFIADLLAGTEYVAPEDWIELVGSPYEPVGHTSSTTINLRLRTGVNNEFGVNSYNVFYDKIELTIEYGKKEFVQVVIC